MREGLVTLVPMIVICLSAAPAMAGLKVSPRPALNKGKMREVRAAEALAFRYTEKATLRGQSTSACASYSRPFESTPPKVIRFFSATGGDARPQGRARERVGADR